MSSVYEKAIYKQRKEYLANYYQTHKEEISRKAHEKYEARKEHAKKQRELEREGIKTQMCTKYCKYVDDADFGYMSRQMLQEICKRCPINNM